MKTRKGYKTYPLTAAQRFHFFYMEHCPKKEVVNVGTSLTIEYELNIDVLRQAIYKAYERCDAMRLRFAYDKKENQWYQYIVEKEEREIEYVDFSGKSMEEAEQFAATAMRGWINMQATLVAMKGITGNTVILLTLTAVLTALPAYHHKRKRKT